MMLKTLVGIAIIAVAIVAIGASHGQPVHPEAASHTVYTAATVLRADFPPLP